MLRRSQWVILNPALLSTERDYPPILPRLIPETNRQPYAFAPCYRQQGQMPE